MQRKISKDIIFLTINLLLIIIVGIYAITKNKTEYTLTLPSIDNIESIEITNNDNKKLIKDEESISEIIKLLSNKKTNTDSIQDSPTNTDELYQVNFVYKEVGSSFIYLYKRRNNYYIESPYNGVYKISKEEYKNLVSSK